MNRRANLGERGFMRPHGGDGGLDCRQAAFLGRLLSFTKALMRLAARNVQVGLAIDCLLRAAERLVRDYQGLPIRPSALGRRGASPKDAGPARPLTPVETLDLKMQADRRIRVTINHATSFALSPAVSAILGLLYQTACKAPNGQVPWMKYATISALVNSPGQIRPPSKHVISNQLCRLRRVFEERGYDPSVLERAPGLGARLVLRSVPKPPVPPGTPGGWTGLEHNQNR